MAQVPECVVCLQPYDDYLHVPRVLACGHSLCELCLMQLQSAWQQPSLLTSGGSKESNVPAGALIRCPECSHRTKLPIGGQRCLPKNVELLRLLPCLIEESCSATERSDTQKRSGGKGSEVGGNRSTQRRADGRRNISEMKPKEKEGVVPTGSSSWSFADSWLVPRELFSGNITGDLRAWILPEKAVTLREETSVTTIKHAGTSKQELLFGEVILEQERLSSTVPVTLLRLEVNRPAKEETLSYEQFVRRVWEEGLLHEAKIELLILLQISLVCRRLCKIFGLWMNQRNDLFLVSEIPKHGVVVAWETIMKSQLALNPLKSCRNDELPDPEQGRETAASVQDDISLPKIGTPQLASGKWPGADKEILARVGPMRSLCEALSEVHSQGVIFGLVSPRCFVLDRFENVLVHPNAALRERYSLHEEMTSNRSFVCAESSLQGQGSLEGQEQGELQHTRNCWQYMSPEVLALLRSDIEDLDHPIRTSGKVSDMVQGHITCKADVWSLGCLFLELLSGKPPHDGLAFRQVWQKVAIERGKPEELLRLEYSLEHDADVMDAGGHLGIKDFKNLLVQCFEYKPEDRPDVDVLWLNLINLGSAGFIPKRSFPKQHGSITDEKYWILCLPGFVLEGFLDAEYGRNGQLKKSMRRLHLDNGVPDNGRDLKSGLKPLSSLAGHEDYVTALVICGDHLLSASFDKTIRVWSLEDHELQQTLDGHSHVVNALAVDQNTFRCFSGDSSGTICVWNIEGDSVPPSIATWQEHNDWRYTGVASLTVSADGTLYSGSGDRTIKAWSSQDFVLLGTMEGHKSVVATLLVDRELLYSGSWDGTIRVWWRSDHSPLAVLGADASTVHSLGGVRTLCMADSFLFAGHDNGAIQVWRDEKCFITVKAHETVVSTLCVEGDFLYSGSWDQQVKAWKIDEFLLDPLPALVADSGYALSSLVSDGERLYAGLAERAIKVYSLLGDTWASLLQMLNP